MLEEQALQGRQQHVVAMATHGVQVTDRSFVVYGLQKSGTIQVP